MKRRDWMFTSRTKKGGSHAIPIKSLCILAVLSFLFTGNADSFPGQSTPLRRTPWPRARYQSEVALVPRALLKGTHRPFPVVEQYEHFALVSLNDSLAFDTPGETFRRLQRFYLRVHDLAWDTRQGEPEIPDEWKMPFGSDGFYLIQFYGPPKADWLTSLEKEGVQWVGPYFRSFTYLAWLKGRTLKNIARYPFINWVGAYHPYYRFPPRYRQNALSITRYRVFHFSPAGQDNAVILSHIDSSGARVIQHVYPRNPRIPDYFVVQAKTRALEVLASDPYIWLIEPIYPYTIDLSTSRELVQTGIGNGCSGSLTEVPLWAVGITGSGPFPSTGPVPGTEQIVAILDTHFNHPDLECGTGIPNGTIMRYVEYNSASTACAPRDASDCIASGVFHGTAVAGIIAGSGEKDGGESPPEACTRKGLAFGSRLWLLNCDDLNDALSCLNFCTDTDTLDSFFTLSYADGARISNHSWGASAFGDYTALSSLVDGWAYDNDPNTPEPEQTFLWLFAAGNAGPSSPSLNTPATAKNDVTVAAIYNGTAGVCWPGDSSPCDENKIVYYSSRGPTEDGRHGPDISGPSQYISAPFDGNNYTLFNGTSAATPEVTGAVTLIRDWLINVHGISSPSASLLKAILLNATEYVPGHVLTPNEDLPGVNQGWGRVNLSILCDDFSTPGCNQRRSLWFEGTFTATGQQSTFSINVTDSSTPLHCTLTWLDPPNLPTGQIRNNLDFWIEAPDGSCYPGNNLNQGNSVSGNCSGIDSVNVDEGIRIANPTTGAWLLHVEAITIDPTYPQQPWSLVCSGSIIAKPLVVIPSVAPATGIPTVCNATPATSDYTVTAFGGTGGFQNDVLLSLLGSDPPDPGFSATFLPNPIPAPPSSGSSSQMTLQVSPTVSPGTYTFTVQGDDGTLTVEADNRIRVHSTVPSTPSPLSPSFDTFVNFVGTTFRWQLQSDADTYNFYLYDTPDCSGAPILSRTQLSGDMLTLTSPAEDLQPDATYSWRIESANACGTTPSPCVRFYTWKCATDPELVNNGSFETGDLTGWVVDETRGLAGIPGARTSQAFDGAFSVQLGDYPAFFGFTTPGADAVYQELTVPAEGATLEFYAYFASVESPGFDIQEATITDTNGVVLKTIFRYGDDERPLNQSWTRFEVDLTPWSGQIIRIHFQVSQDAIYKTGMFIDAVTTKVKRCGPPSYNIDLPQNIYDLCAGKGLFDDVPVISRLRYPILVNLGAINLPGGLQVYFFPNPFYTNELVRMSIFSNSSTPAGLHSITIKGTGVIGSESLEVTQSFKVRVASTPPSPPIPVEPRHGSVLFTQTPQFRWTTIGSPENPDNKSTFKIPKRVPLHLSPNRNMVITTNNATGNDPNLYRLLVDEKCDFISPVIDVTISGNSFTPGTGILKEKSAYCWTVIASNACGPGPGSEPNKFFIAGCFEKWELVPELPKGRWGSCSVGLNGRLYVFGGFDSSFQATDDAWVFDPTTNTWAAVDPMPAPRAHMGCTVLNDLIYVIGGTDGIAPSSMVWIYDPATNSWNSASSLPQPLQGPATATIENSIYVCGGLSGITGSATSSCYRYDGFTGLWSSTFTLTRARYRTHGAAIGTLFFAVGSNPGNGASPDAHLTIDICDTTTGTCSASSTAPYPLWFDPGVAAFNGKIYILGLDSGPEPRQTSIVYDPTTDVFSDFPSLLSPQNNTSASIVDSMLYVAGGYDGITLGVTTVERYVFCTTGGCSGQWVEADPVPEGRTWACAVSYDGKLFTFGGVDASSSLLQSVWSYDPASRVWSPMTPMPEPNAYSGCTVVGSLIHLVGGWDGFAPRADHWIYDPSTNSWSTSTPLPDGRFGPAVASVNGELYVCGGMLASTGLATADCLHWNAQTSTWEPAPFTLSQARWRTTGVAVNSWFLAVGSNRGLGETPDAAWTIDVCDPAAGTCTTSTRSLFPLEFNPGVAAYNGKVIIAGLNVGSGNLRTVLEYDPTGDDFRFFAPLSRNQNNTTSAVVNDTMYLVGGYDGQNLGLNLVQAFTFCPITARALQADYNRGVQLPAIGPRGPGRIHPLAPGLPKQKKENYQDSPRQKRQSAPNDRIPSQGASEPDPR